MLIPNGENWDPHTHLYQDQEENMTDYRGEIKPNNREEHIIASTQENEYLQKIISHIERTFVDTISDVDNLAMKLEEQYTKPSMIASI